MSASYIDTVRIWHVAYIEVLIYMHVCVINCLSEGGRKGERKR